MNDIEGLVMQEAREPRQAGLRPCAEKSEAALVRVQREPRDETGDRANDRRRRLEALYREHRDQLLRYFRRRGHGADTAEDMVQDVFVRMSGLPDMLLIERAGAMVYRIARFVSADAYRARARRRRSGIESEDEATFDIADAAPTPEQSLIWRETIDALFALAAQLPKRCGEVMALHRLQGMTQPEIAQKRGVTLKTVEKQVSAGARSFDAPARTLAQSALAR